MVNFIKDLAKALKKYQTSLLQVKQGNTGIFKHWFIKKSIINIFH